MPEPRPPNAGFFTALRMRVMIMASPPIVSLLIAVLTIGIFVLDLVTPLGWADGFLYLIPLILMFRSSQHHRLVGFTALCCGLIILGWIFSPPGGAIGPVIYNRSIGMALLWVTALFLRHRKQVEEALCLSQGLLERKVEERTDEFRLAIEKLQQEIVDRKRAEAALRSSEQRLRLIMEHANDAILYINLNGTIQWVSHHTEVMTGQPSDTLIGRPVMALLSPNAAAQAEARLAAVRQGQAVPPLVELEFLRSDGVPVVTEVNIASVQEQGRVVGRLLVARDITERKQAEDLLIRSRDFYLSILQEFPAMVWRSGINAKCDYFNNTWLFFTGRTLKQELGDGWTEGVHPDDVDQCVERYRKAFHAREPFILEYRLRRHDGEYRHILDHGSPFNDLDGNFAGFIGSCHDITERKHVEEALRESERRTRAILAGALDAVVGMDTEGSITYWNPRSEAIFGWTRSEAVGRKMSDLIIPPQHREAHERGLRHFLATGSGPVLNRR
ncbi:MAG: PAS domain S-box protein, partial [Nitrospirae bacterium]